MKLICVKFDDDELIHSHAALRLKNDKKEVVYHISNLIQKIGIALNMKMYRILIIELIVVYKISHIIKLYFEKNN